MNLVDFEDYIDDVILDRGWNYFLSGNIENIKEIEKNFFVFEVIGSDVYTVEIILTEDQEIVHSTCDCPYDWGEYCKHEVSAMYALKEHYDENHNLLDKKQDPLQQKKTGLKEILKSLSKDQLIEIILSIASNDEQIKQMLLFQYSSEEDEIANSKRLIKNHINEAKHRGFIQWDDVPDALYGADLTLKKALEKIENGEEEKAVYLCLMVLPIVIGMLEYSDDSSGFIGSTVEEILEIIKEGVASGIETFDEEQQQRIFRSIMEEAHHDRYDGWEEWSITLLECATYFCKKKEFRKELETYIQKEISRKSNASMYGEYVITKLRLLQLKIIELWDSDQEILDFMYMHIENPSIREKAVLYLLNKEEYRRVIKLCEDIEAYKNQAVNWKKYKLMAYEGLGDVENQRKVLLELLYKNETTAYDKLKSLYDQEEWNSILPKILGYFEDQTYFPQVYVNILIAEKLYKKLLDYCRANIYYIERYYSYLINDYYDEVESLFQTYIKQSAEEASNRSQYRKVCHKITSYKNIFSKERTQTLINELMEKYKRRPAFIDELSKIRL